MPVWSHVMSVSTLCNVSCKALRSVKHYAILNIHYYLKLYITSKYIYTHQNLDYNVYKSNQKLNCTRIYKHAYQHLEYSVCFQSGQQRNDCQNKNKCNIHTSIYTQMSSRRASGGKIAICDQHISGYFKKQPFLTSIFPQ